MKCLVPGIQISSREVFIVLVLMLVLSCSVFATEVSHLTL